MSFLWKHRDRAGDGEAAPTRLVGVRVSDWVPMLNSPLSWEAYTIEAEPAERDGGRSSADEPTAATGGRGLRRG